MNYESERFVALQAVLKACLLCQAVQASLVSEETISKKDNSPVTVADFGAQAVINLGLMRAFPNDLITAEEDAADLRISKNANVKEKVLYHVNAVFPRFTEEQILTAIDYGNHNGGSTGRFWTLDPIDGTKGFLRGEQYAIALALVEKGEVVLGVLGCPNLPVDANRPDEAKGCLFIAVKGQGAKIRSFDDPTEIQINVTNIGDPSMASFCESVESAHSSHSDAALISEILGVTAPRVRIDSQCKYAVLARGDASIYLRLPTSDTYVEKIWDHAAGWIVVKEAGGKVTDVYGNPLDFSVGRGLDRNKGIVGTNGKLHSQVIAAVRQVLKPEKT
jgi:3'(2'), 5'-bisphosphate nucleotidase